jgi:magnesium chelatase accessory protein
MPTNQSLSKIPAFWPNRAFSQTQKIAGLDWHYQMSRHDNPLAKTILLLHGTGSSAHTWADIFPLLARDYTVVAPDMPGHGFTQGAKKGNLHFSEIAKNLYQLLNAISVTDPDAVIGHSAGADCALALCALEAKTPAVIIGLNPAFINPLNTYNLFLGPMLNPMATSGIMAGFLANSLPMTRMVDQLLDSTNSKLTETQRKPYRLLFREQSHIYGALNYMTSWNIEELLQKSQSIQCAFTFLVAAQDPWIPQANLLPVIHQYFPNAVIRIEEGGHLFHETNLVRTMQILHEALAALDLIKT